MLLAIHAALAAFIVLGLAPASAESPPTFLECTGHDDLHGTPIEHEVAIFSNRAELDGTPYYLKKSRTEFTLTGPVPKSDRVLYINRLTGEWALTPSTSDGNPTGKLQSSGKSEGCKVKQRKF